MKLIATAITNFKSCPLQCTNLQLQEKVNVVAGDNFELRDFRIDRNKLRVWLVCLER